MALDRVRTPLPLPYDVIERIGEHCDTDARRHLGLKPRKLELGCMVPIDLSNGLRVEVPIAGTRKTLIIVRQPERNMTTYLVSAGWLPSASRHVFFYHDGVPGIHTTRDECEYT